MCTKSNNRIEDMAQLLHKRKLVHQFTGLSLEELLDESKVAYIGMDPTAPAIHIGYLVPIMLCKTLAEFGIKIIVLLGGATSRIGDPTGKTSIRKMLDLETIEDNSKKLKKAIEKFFPDAQIVDNYEWLSKVSFLDFVSIAKHVSMNDLVKNEMFANRLENNQPLSMMEMLYPVMQGYDFYHLNKEYGCNLQLSGADQWNNMLMGVELNRRLADKKVFGLTCPLLLTKDGKKMGKTETGTIWLDPELCTPFDFWQYWRNIDDADCIKYIELLTNTSTQMLVNLEKQGINACKEYLATQITAFVHNEEIAYDMQARAKQIFGKKDLSDIDQKSFSTDEHSDGIQLVNVVVSLAWTVSKGEAKKLIDQGGVTIDGVQIKDISYVLKKGQQYVLCKGKKEYCRAIIS